MQDKQDQTQDPTAQVRSSCFKPFFEWTQPTPFEIRQVIKKTGLSRTEISSLLGMADNKNDLRKIRKWTSESEEKQIPYAHWVVLCFEAGLGYIAKAKPTPKHTKENDLSDC